jgi:WD40 repeat protein
VSEEHEDPHVSGNTDEGQERRKGRFSLSERERNALSITGTLICVFAGALSVVTSFTKNTTLALFISCSSLVLVVLVIVGINRARGIIRFRVRLPAYLLLAVAIVLIAIGFFGRTLWKTTPDHPSATQTPSISQSSSAASSSPASVSPATSPPASAPSPSGPPVSLSAPDKDVIAIPAAFSLDGTLVAGAGNNEPTDVYAWNARTDNYIGTLALGSSFSLEGLALTPDDKSLMVLDAAGGVCQWDLSGTRCSTLIADPSWYNGGPWNAAISGDAGTVAYQDPAGTGVDVVSVTTGRQIAQFTDPSGAPLVGADYTGNDQPGSAISLDQDGGVLTAGDAAGHLYVWDTGTGRLLATLRFSPSATLNGDGPAATLSPDGQTVLVPEAGNGLESTLWSVATQANITPANHLWPQQWDNGTGSVFFTSNGKEIVTYRDDQTGADLWDATTLTYVAPIPFTGSYAAMGLEAYAASGQDVLTDDGKSHIALWPIP